MGRINAALSFCESADFSFFAFLMTKKSSSSKTNFFFFLGSFCVSVLLISGAYIECNANEDEFMLRNFGLMYCVQSSLFRFVSIIYYF